VLCVVSLAFSDFYFEATIGTPALLPNFLYLDLEQIALFPAVFWPCRHEAI